MHKNGKYTYADYLNWPDDVRYELIEGTPFLQPSPSVIHQEISVNLLVEFKNYLQGKPCKVFHAPFDVRLFADKETDADVFTVVQPDLLIVCDPDKLDERGCKGSPDLVVEIISPSSAKIDRWMKYHLYEKAGVEEYWIVDPLGQTIEVFLLAEGNYVRSGVFGKDDRLKSAFFSELEMNLMTVFE